MGVAGDGFLQRSRQSSGIRAISRVQVEGSCLVTGSDDFAGPCPRTAECVAYAGLRLRRARFGEQRRVARPLRSREDSLRCTKPTPRNQMRHKPAPPEIPGAVQGAPFTARGRRLVESCPVPGILRAVQRPHRFVVVTEANLVRRGAELRSGHGPLSFQRMKVSWEEKHRAPDGKRCSNTERSRWSL